MGRYILHGLNSSGIQIRAMVRNPQTARFILPPGVEIIQGDIQRLSDLEKAFDGIDSLFLNLNSIENVEDKHWQPLNQGLSTLLVFARMNSVRHVIFHSTLASHAVKENNSGLKLPMLHRQAERFLANSGLAYTIFRTSLFMENFYHRFRSGNQIRLNPGKNLPIYWLSAFEFGRLVAESICNPQLFNQIFTLQGKEALGIEDAARRFVKTYKSENLEFKCTEGNLHRFFALVRPKKLEESLWTKLVTENPEKQESQVTWNLLGEPTFDFERFIEEIKPIGSSVKDVNLTGRLQLVY